MRVSYWLFLFTLVSVAMRGPATVLAETSPYAGPNHQDGDKQGEAQHNPDPVDLVLKEGERFTRFEVYGTGQYTPHDVVSAIKAFAKTKEGQEHEVGTVGRIPQNGQAKNVRLDDDEYLVGFEAQQGQFFDVVRFVTNKTTSDWVGGVLHPFDAAHAKLELSAGSGKKVVGLRLWSHDRDISVAQLIIETP